MCIALAVCYIGDEPLLAKVMRYKNWSQASAEVKRLKQLPKEQKEQIPDNSEVPL